MSSLYNFVSVGLKSVFKTWHGDINLKQKLMTVWITISLAYGIGTEISFDRLPKSEVSGLYIADLSGDNLAVLLLHPDICWPRHSQGILKEQKECQNLKFWNNELEMFEDNIWLSNASYQKMRTHIWYQSNLGRVHTGHFAALICWTVHLCGSYLVNIIRITTIYSHVTTKLCAYLDRDCAMCTGTTVI